MKHALISLTLGLALVLGLLVLLPPTAFTGRIASGRAASSVIFVDQNVTGAVHNGESWETAYKFLEDALQHAEATDQIWVAAGVYTPTNEASVNATFQLVEGVAIYGGFTGVAEEDSLNDRNWEDNITILSGDLEGDDITEGSIVTNPDNISGTNAYHVVTGSGMSAAAILDGFTITAGNANGNGDNGRGGGMFTRVGSPTLRNIVFRGNYAEFGGGMEAIESSNPVLEYVTFINNTSGDDGGGMHTENSAPTLDHVTIEYNNAIDGGGMYNYNSNPTLIEVAIIANQASYNGGGMHNNFGSNPKMTNVTFRGNQARLGGGMYNNQESHSTLTNALFSGNKADQNGGGMYNLNNSDPILTNVTLSGNSAELDGGGILNGISSNPTISNCILWDNSALENDEISGIELSIISYSNIRGITPESSNISEEPSFVAPVVASSAPTTTGDYHLMPGSPSIDTGDNNAPGLNNITTDLDGNQRFADGNRDGDPIVDMGTYEFFSSIYYVDKTAEGPEHDGFSWTRAYLNIQDALKFAKPGDEIWVAKGVYYPDEGQRNDDPTSTFRLTKGIAIYGGFAGDEESLDERNWEDNLTILSGDLEDNDSTVGKVVTNTDYIIGSNAYHVVTGNDVTETARLDGFTITAGNAHTTSGDENGGGMINYNSSSPTIANITFSGNRANRHGGGMYNYDNSSPTLRNITFHNNQASNNGGGMYNHLNSFPTLLDVTFSNNKAENGGAIFNYTDHLTLTQVTFKDNLATADGGGMYNYENSNPIIVNVILDNNSASNGGGMYNYNSNPILLNVTISGNHANQNGGGMYNNNSNPVLTNTILWGNHASRIGPEIHDAESSQPDISYSNIGSREPTGSNISENPHFIDPVRRDYRLRYNSPVIDKGNNDSFINNTPFSITTDLDGSPRFVDGDDKNGPVIDMGAYEFQATVEIQTVYLPLLIR